MVKTLKSKKDSRANENLLPKKQNAFSIYNNNRLFSKKQGTNKKKMTVSKSTVVCLKYPDKVSIEFVQANELRHYELFQWLTSIFASAAIGFWVAYFTLNTDDKPLLFSSIAFSISALIFLCISWRYRKKVFNGSIEKIISIDDFKNKA